LLLDSRTVPLDGKSNLLLRYRGGKRTFPYVSAGDVLTADARRHLQGQDRLRWNDASARARSWRHPIDTLFAGVEVQATVADNLLQQDLFTVPSTGR
jgi:adenylate cyclase